MSCNKHSSTLVLHQSWSVYMEKLLPLQLQTMVHFSFMGKNQAVSYFAQTKIVTCIRERSCVSCKWFYTSLVSNTSEICQASVVKDTMNDNYGRPFFVCSERKNPCKFWQWGDVFEGLRPLCQHEMVCCERKVKKDGPNQNRLLYCCPKEDSCGFFEWKPREPRVINTGIVLFSNPLQYQYMIEETGETFNSSKSNTKEAYDEFRRFGLTSELDKIDLL